MELDLKNSFIYAGSDGNSGFRGDKSTIEFFSVLDSYQRAGDVLSRACRVKYAFGDNSLKRTCLKGLDALRENPQIPAEELSSQIKDIAFQYAYPTGSAADPYAWQDTWPKDEAQKKNLPQAVKIKLGLIEKDRRKISQEVVIEFNKGIALPQAEKNAP
jgi:hypothetical protein